MGRGASDRFLSDLGASIEKSLEKFLVTSLGKFLEKFLHGSLEEF